MAARVDLFIISSGCFLLQEQQQVALKLEQLTAIYKDACEVIKDREKVVDDGGSVQYS